MTLAERAGAIGDPAAVARQFEGSGYSSSRLGDTAEACGRAGPDLSWSDLGKALAAVGLPEHSRPSHLAAFARLLAEASGARRALDPFAASPSFTGEVSEAATLQEVVGIVPSGHLLEQIGAERNDKVRWLTGYPWDLLGPSDELAPS